VILITGGLGFIGPHAARALLARGQSCVLTRHRSSRVPEFLASELQRRVFIEQVDLADRDELLELGQRHPITGILHLAATGFAGDQPLEYVRLSSHALFNVLEAAQRWEASRVCLASTIGIYAGALDQPGPVQEDTPVPLQASAPLAIPTVKRSAELLANFVATHAPYEVITMRFSAIWGPLGRDHSPFFAAPALVHAAVRGTALELLPRQQNRHAEDATDMCYVKDCADAIALLQTANTLNHTTYNVAAGRATSNAELLTAIQNAVPGTELELPVGRDPDGPGQDKWLDISRLCNDTGYQPQYSADRAVTDYVAWLRGGNEHY
jgi:UDP-glucose 4-epimerase